MSDFTIDRDNVIGIGGSSTVYSGMDKDGTHVAIKSIDLDRIRYEEVVREVNIQKTIQHPNIAPLLYCGTGENKEELWLIMPRYKYSLRKLLDDTYPSGIHDPCILATILYDICSALDYLHDSDIIHRDIKAANVMIDESGKAILADFGVSAMILRDIRMTRRTFTGSMAWMAPEVLQETGHTTKADIWSLGILALELAYGKPPYAEYPPIKVMMFTIQNPPPTFDLYNRKDVKLPKLFHNFVRKCLRKNSDDRPSIKKLLTHRFFRKYSDIN